MRGLFGILFRSHLLELLKVLAVASSVLVTVISFGAAIKPLSENLLGPADLLRYMLFATIPMLQFALPFAAAFAGVIVFHRLASDNEIVAMATSGLSYQRILAPAIALAVLLTAAMVVIVDLGAPTFWQALRRIKGSDLTRLLVARIDRGEAFRVGGTEIYADEAHVVDAPADTGAQRRLVLVGVAAVELASDGTPKREFAARYATVDFHRLPSGDVLKVALTDATSYSAGEGAIAGASVVRPELIDLGQRGRASPKELRLAELWRLPSELERFPPIVVRRDELRATLSAADAWRAIDAALAAGDSVAFEATDGSRWLLEGGRLVGQQVVGGEGGLRLRQLEGAGVRTQAGGRTATLTLVSSEPGAQARFDLLVEDATMDEPRTGSARRALRLTDLALVGGGGPSREALDNAELLAAAEATAGGFVSGPIESVRAAIASRAAELDTQIGKLRAEVVARLVQRSAQALTAPLMLFFGAMLAILLRRKAALLVYLVAFLPAIATILLISGGEQMLRDATRVDGFAVAYSGVLGLAVASLVGWRILARH
jgi:lipopolysaccharide export LptBFGC system permease protein LptF